MSNNIPPIAEKIKFWEEQDKINQAVIPRIIEMNESIKNLAKQLGEIDSKIALSESRIQKRLKKEITHPKSDRVLITLAMLISIISLLITLLK